MPAWLTVQGRAGWMSLDIVGGLVGWVVRSLPESVRSRE